MANDQLNPIYKLFETMIIIIINGSDSLLGLVEEEWKDKFILARGHDTCTRRNNITVTNSTRITSTPNEGLNLLGTFSYAIYMQFNHG